MMNCLAEQKLVGRLRDYIADVNACETETALYASCRQLATDCGYHSFALLGFPEDYHYSLYDLILSSNWPVSLLKSYDEAFLLKESAFAQQTRDNSQPFLWTAREMYNSASEENGSLGKALFSMHAMTHGVGIKVVLENDQKGFLLLTGDKDLKNESDFDDLQHFANHAFAKAVELRQFDSRSESKLSKREYECLLWTSEGKTSYEIGMILGLSENTINNYLVTVGRKLGAVNRPHMVGIALRRGYI